MITYTMHLGMALCPDLDLVYLIMIQQQQDLTVST